MSKVVTRKCVPTSQQDYHKLLWYERDIMSYTDHFKYENMRDDPNSYFKNVKVVNFYIIHHECCGDKLVGTQKNYQTNESEHLADYAKKDAKVVLLAAFRKMRDDLRIKRELMMKNFGENFNCFFILQYQVKMIKKGACSTDNVNISFERRFCQEIQYRTVHYDHFHSLKNLTVEYQIFNNRINLIAPILTLIYIFMISSIEHMMTLMMILIFDFEK